MLIQFSRGQFLDLLWPQIPLVLRVESLMSWYSLVIRQVALSPLECL